MAEPQRPIDSSTEVSLKRKSAWADPGCGKIWCPGRVSQEEQETPYIYLSYMALLSDIIDAEPSNFEDVVGKQV